MDRIEDQSDGEAAAPEAPAGRPAPEGPTGRAAGDRPKSRRFVVLSWALVAAWACFIFAMSANTGTDLNDGGSLVSRIYQALKDVQAQILGPEADAINSIAHFCEYTVFGALWTNALRCHVPLRRACLIAVACTSLYGVTDEFHQLFVPDRACDPVDWLVDTCGGALGATLAYRALHHRETRGDKGTGLMSHSAEGRNFERGRE